MRVPWDRIGNIAQIIVALIASATLAFTVIQSQKTADQTGRQSKSLTALVMPL